jgi:hypothetical protein
MVLALLGFCPPYHRKWVVHHSGWTRVGSI